MPTQIGIGFSQAIDINTAARDAAFLSKTDLNADRIDAAIILSTVHYNPHHTVPIIRELLNETKMIGCSTAGIIMSGSIETRGLAVLTICSDEMKFGIGSVENLHTHDNHRAGNLLARNTLADSGRHNRNVFIFFADGRLGNNSLFLKGLQETLGDVIPILGAGSSDDFHFDNTFQVFQDRILTNAATGIMIEGHASVSVGCQHGWRPLGKPRVVDWVEGNIIKRISGKKASALYQEYFGSEAEGLKSNQFGRMSILYPLGIYIEGSNEYLLRNAVDILPDGSIVCQGDIPEGANVHVMIGNKDSCKQAATQAAKEAQKGLINKKPKLIIIFESMARLKLLGRAAFEEIKRIKNVFGSDVPIIGMYADGETSPFQTAERYKKPYFLNESIVVIAIA